MLTTIILGILSSSIAEIVTALNKKLDGTVLKGDAAFLVALAMALPVALLKEILMPHFTFADLTNYTKLVADFSEVFAISQVYFMFVVQKLNLDVSSAGQPGPKMVMAAPAGDSGAAI